MLLSSFGLKLAFLYNALASASAVPEKRATCPLTAANVYRYGCGLAGWAQFPSTLKVLSKGSLLDCAKACRGNAACKSFRYVKGSQKCYLYKKYLHGMEFTTENFEPGIFYERECYTTNCDVIDACTVPDQCSMVDAYKYGYYYYYTDFGCGYGVTAKLDQYQHKEVILPGGWTACKAINKCANNAPHGSFIVSYHIPDKNWICTLYKNTGAYPYAYSLHNQHINDMTLTVKNSSIGASFGYWWYDAYDNGR